MRIGIVGAGAIGGFLAAALTRAGVNVAIVARGAHLEAIRSQGLKVESDLGTFDAAVEADDDIRRLGDFDALFLTFKAHQWPGLLPQLEAFAGSETALVTLQNGVPFWYVREPALRSVDPDGRIGRLFPDRQVVGGVVHVSGHVVRPGVVHQSGGLRYVFGEPAGGTSARVDELVGVLQQAALGPEADTAIRTTVWLKLVNNVGLNAVSTLRRMTIKPMLADREARRRVHELMEEALHVGQALGVVADVDIDARIAYAARLDDVKTSMLQDYEAGRSLELDPILGAAIELGERYGVPVRRMREAYDELKHRRVRA
jgi:2-dehydropantoate 2-reductase